MRSIVASGRTPDTLANFTFQLARMHLCVRARTVVYRSISIAHARWDEAADDDLSDRVVSETRRRPEYVQRDARARGDGDIHQDERLDYDCQL